MRLSSTYFGLFYTPFMSPLILAPWEQAQHLDLLLGDEEHAVHSIPWGGENIPFLFQRFQRNWPLIPKMPIFIFARPLESHDEGNWLVCEQSDSSYQSFSQSKPMTPQEHIQEIVQGLRETDGRFSLNRFCVVNEQLDNPYVVMEAEQGVWLSSDLRPKTRFKLTMESNVFKTNGRAIARLIQSLIHDPNSDISFARHWVGLGTDQKVELLLRGYANLEQIRRVMRWTLACETSLWESATQWSWELKPVEDHNYGFLYSDTTHCSIRYGDVQEAPLILRMHRFLLESYIPYLCAPLWEKHSCTHDFPDLNNSTDCYTILRVENSFSAHEKMEARFELRDWLEQNAFPDELAVIGLF